MCRVIIILISIVIGLGLIIYARAQLAWRRLNMDWPLARGICLNEWHAWWNLPIPTWRKNTSHQSLNTESEFGMMSYILYAILQSAKGCALLSFLYIISGTILLSVIRSLTALSMDMGDWQRIASIIAYYTQYDGFLVLHGTDTMAYTASALSFMLENLGKSVILTGSQIPLRCGVTLSVVKFRVIQ